MPSREALLLVIIIYRIWGRKVCIFSCVCVCVCTCRHPPSLLLGVTEKYSVSRTFLLQKEHEWQRKRICVLTVSSYPSLKNFLSIYSEHSSVLSRMQRLKTKWAESLCPSCSQPPGDRCVNRRFHYNMKAVLSHRESEINIQSKG